MKSDTPKGKYAAQVRALDRGPHPDTFWFYHGCDKLFKWFTTCSELLLCCSVPQTALCCQERLHQQGRRNAQMNPGYIPIIHNDPNSLIPSHNCLTEIKHLNNNKTEVFSNLATLHNWGSWVACAMDSARNSIESHLSVCPAIKNYPYNKIMSFSDKKKVIHAI